uniref:Uncharacterized protein n=1 Tax=Panagrolaimus sp. PS1159 TaxID=55785 RepID=A0AC35GNZ7_9BILA
ETSFISSEEQEKTQGVLKSASQAEIEAKLKESQETMRNLIEQHQIVDTDLATIQQVRESPRSSQERSMKAASDEQKQIDTSLEGKPQEQGAYAIRKSPSQTDIAAKVKAAGDEISKIDTTFNSKEEHIAAQSTLKTSHASDAVATMKSAGDEKQDSLTTLSAKAETESASAVQKASNQAEIAAKLKESQETMRNLIEQHEIVDTDLATVSKYDDTARSSQERSMKAASEETQQTETSITSAEHSGKTESLQKTTNEANIAAKLVAAGNEKKDISTTFVSSDEQQTTRGVLKTASQIDVNAQMKAAGDEKKQIATSFNSSEEQEKTQ